MTLILRNDPQNKLSPLPGYLEEYRGGIANFGLFFQKFGKYHRDSHNELKTQDSWNNRERGKNRKDYEWSLLKNQFDQYVSIQNSASESLGVKNKNQFESLCAFSDIGVEIVELSATNSTRFLTGIGETTPTEVGMVFDRNLGIPFIPASSIKGAVRYAYCVNFVRNKNMSEESIEENDVDGLVELFGSLDTKNSARGGFSFMDAYPDNPPELVMDIMNPHHGKYYNGEGKDGPVETEEPKPIKFLAVEKGACFKFRGFFLSKNADKYRKELINAFETALTELGLGAKTAVGYGRFENFKDTGFAIVEASEQRKKDEIQRLEKQLKDAEKKKRQAEIDEMTPEEKILFDFQENNVRAEKASEIFRKIDEYDDGMKIKIARALKAFWVAEKSWTQKEVGGKKWRKKIRSRNQKIDKILDE